MTEVSEFSDQMATVSAGSTVSSDESMFSNNEAITTPLHYSSKETNHTGKRPVIGRTADGTIFAVPETHDMVRSLFDPTVRKSYGEVLIFLSLLANFGVYKALGSKENRTIGFVCLYAFWRLAYNVGIGFVLYMQSNHNAVVEFAKRQGLFKGGRKETIFQALVSLEIQSKMGKDYDVEKYPIEFSTWIVFRQFVDLILMQDFTSYMFLVYTCGLDSTLAQTPSLNYTRIVLGSLMVLFNLWVKVDAHRVVKDYAWYWGDFFFLQESELIFDGVFNLSPHPMYSIGYIGYYGFALITKSYLVLIVSLIAQSLQFAFLNYVEEPHIEKTYGSDNTQVVVEELEHHEFYLKPLILLKNFSPIRVSDYLTVILSAYNLIAPFAIDAKNDYYTCLLFAFAFFVKAIQSFVVSYVLHKQSTEKWWTKLYLKYGVDNIVAFSNWQVTYNLLLVLSYTSLLGIAAREIMNGQYRAGNWILLRFILGSLLVVLQMWTSSSIYNSIGDFGWFYGDFFLPKMSTKTLSKSGIYRYLNDPERVLGVSGIWGLTLITYSPFVFVLAMLWTIHIALHLSFVEKPHMLKVYGEQQVKKNVSGVSLTLQQILPKKWNNLYINAFDRVDQYVKKRTQSETVDRKKVTPFLHRGSISHQFGYSLEILNLDVNWQIEIGKPIKVRWRAPATHHAKDWLGLYQVMKTGSSRRQTRTSSAGKWIALNPSAYQGRSQGILVEESIEPNVEGEVVGVAEFKDSLLSFEKGVYELRYHENGTHKVLSISQPFEIVVPSLPIDETMPKRLLELLKRMYRISSVEDAIDFKRVPTKNLSDIISNATGIDIAPEVISKLKTISNISTRIEKSKKILDELNDDQ